MNIQKSFYHFTQLKNKVQAAEVEIKEFSTFLAGYFFILNLSQNNEI